MRCSCELMWLRRHSHAPLGKFAALLEPTARASALAELKEWPEVLLLAEASDTPHANTALAAMP